MDWIQTVIIAIVEGLTEFLPVSSTGHMIIAQNILGVESTEFVKAFTFIIHSLSGMSLLETILSTQQGARSRGNARFQAVDS